MNNGVIIRGYVLYMFKYTESFDFFENSKNKIKMYSLFFFENFELSLIFEYP